MLDPRGVSRDNQPLAAATARPANRAMRIQRMVRNCRSLHLECTDYPAVACVESTAWLPRAGVPHALSLAHQGALAEQRPDEVHRNLSRAIADVESRIELDDVERGKAARVGHHFHAELRLAVGRPA